VDIIERVGVTCVMVTHDQEEAMTMATRIGVMSEGKILQIGKPAEIYETPNCLFVADFIGEANFIDGHVTDIGAPYCTVRASNGLELQGMLQGPSSVGAAVTIAIRPEKLRLTVQAPDNVFTLAAKVEQVVYIGSDTRLTVRLSDTIALDVWEQNNRSTLDRDAYWQRGEQGFVTWNPDNALILTA
jgi:ABC-type Fe3+/spermidine/putrescine transport system ATPase subunit